MRRRGTYYGGSTIISRWNNNRIDRLREVDRNGRTVMPTPRDYQVAIAWEEWLEELERRSKEENEKRRQERRRGSRRRRRRPRP